MRYTGPKARLCRREGINLFGSPKYQKILQKRSGIPGIHGGGRMGKITEYARQLREKQKAKRVYGLSEKQFYRCFQEATRRKGVTGENLFELLERRLDNVLFRSGFALSRPQARQFATHGLFLLNGRRVDIPSIIVNPGDVIEIRSKTKGASIFHKNAEEMKDYTAPDWLKADSGKLKVEVLELPQAKHFESFVDTQLIVEFYSR